MGRVGVVFGVRFLLACAVIGGMLGLARPVLYRGVARVARDVSVLTTPTGMVASVSWQESHTRFQLVSQALREAIHVESVSLLLILVLPACFAFALPAPHRWRASAATLLGCFLVGSVIVGQDLVAFLNRTMEEQGVPVFSPGVSAFHEGWINLGWDFAMIGIPATACILALWPLLEGSPAARRAEETPAAWGRRRLAVTGVSCAVGLAALIGLDQLASARAADEDARLDYLAALGKREPALAEHFLRRGEQALAAGRVRDAAGYFNRAALFPAAQARAAEGMRDARALRQARRSGG
jgi:hypothetical protein